MSEVLGVNIRAHSLAGHYLMIITLYAKKILPEYA